MVMFSMLTEKREDGRRTKGTRSRSEEIETADKSRGAGRDKGAGTEGGSGMEGNRREVGG